MKINIFGSTGEIGSKSLLILKKNFPKYKVNFLLANNNYKKFIKQINEYKPAYACLLNSNHDELIKIEINNQTKILHSKDVESFLLNSKSDITIQAISGYNALNYLTSILHNTDILGLVNKECIVSAGHLFKKIFKKSNTIIFPLDSEHFSLLDLLNINTTNLSQISNVYLTASGGPFLNFSLKDLKNVSLKQAVNHPKWKMGFKNSIDSATLTNKCLELIEAHYLFNIPFNSLKILIHPQALVHSIVEYNNYTSKINYFYHDMSIPIINLFNVNNKYKIFQNKPKYKFDTNCNLNFNKPNIKKFPVLNIFDNMDKKNPENFIKFNCSNEFAVNLFKIGKIKFIDIHNIINWGLSLTLNCSINNIDNIIIYQNKFMNLLNDKYEN